MYCDLPELKRCCFCLPLRPGLIAWAYIKTVAVLAFTAIQIIILVDDFVKMNNGYYRNNTTGVVLQFTLLLLMIVDIVFSVVFLVSAHKKNQELMKRCLHYHVFVFVVSNLIFILFIAYFAFFAYYWAFLFGEMLIFFVAIGILNAVLQFYVILLIRSEVKKLANDCFFKFENNEAAARCHMTIGKLNIGDLKTQDPDKLELVKEEVLPAKI